MSAGNAVTARCRSALVRLAFATLVVWCGAIVVTAIRVERVRGDLARLAGDVAHHNAAHHPRRSAGAREYLQLTLRSGIGHRIRSSSIRLVRRGSVQFVEVRIEAVVGFALGGHPTIGIRVVRSMPVEEAGRLP